MKEHSNRLIITSKARRIAEPFAHNRGGVAFEIARMDDPARRRVDDKGSRFRDGMADRHELHPERPRCYHFGARVARLRSTISASPKSPLASVRALLHSIMPAPVRSRRSFTSVAV